MFSDAELDRYGDNVPSDVIADIRDRALAEVSDGDGCLTLLVLILMVATWLTASVIA